MKDELIWKKFPCLDDGFVCLVDVMGEDASVVQAARVSYGLDDRDGARFQEALHKLFPNGPDRSYADEPEQNCWSFDQEQAARDYLAADARKLIRFMMRHGHTSPFEMAELKFLVRCPMDVWRQWIRHRTANVNEYSTRYTTAIDSAQKTKPEEWRLQSGTNKQGSNGFLPARIDESVDVMADHQSGARLSEVETNLHSSIRKAYEDRLEAGVAREQARKDLPLSTYTEAYWKIDLHNLLHFLSKRMDSHAQLEIRTYANAIGNEIVAKLFPIVWEAFVDYKLEAMTLSRMELTVLTEMLEGRLGHLSSEEHAELVSENGLESRELNEWKAKLKRMGVDT